tara:strand:- start:52716 stop:53306 length:591 start_codon:yes stop_codon:yes gene_type:complete
MPIFQPKDDTDETLIVWLDLETTGLDPRGGEILEFAAFASDLDGNRVGSSIEGVFQHKRENILTSMDDFVIDMHLKSGLLKRVWSDDSQEHINRRNEGKWRDIASWFARLPGKPKKRNLGGNSIHFDRTWLQTKQPNLLKNVSHRMLDVSSLLLIMPQVRESDLVVEHRALSDALMSYDTYVKNFMTLLRPQAKIA